MPASCFVWWLSGQHSSPHGKGVCLMIATIGTVSNVLSDLKNRSYSEVLKLLFTGVHNNGVRMLFGWFSKVVLLKIVGELITRFSHSSLTGRRQADHSCCTGVYFLFIFKLRCSLKITVIWASICWFRTVNHNLPALCKDKISLLMQRGRVVDLW